MKQKDASHPKKQPRFSKYGTKAAEAEKEFYRRNNEALRFAERTYKGEQFNG